MKILVAGDFCPSDRVATLVANRDYSFFDGVKDIINCADYSIVNFECPVVEGKVSPINKCGPSLCTERSAIEAVKYAGFDCVTLANNHFRDYGDDGCLTTLEELNRHNIDYVGGGANIYEAQRVLYKEIAGQKIAILNFCENEFSIATENTAGSAPLDIVDNYHQIITARKNADLVLVIVHGGHEYYQLPSPRMKKIYRFFLELGADAVVNHHQHCFSGYEYYNGKPIVYGLGNLCFDESGNRNRIWNEGYCVEIDFRDHSTQIILHPFIQCNNEPVVTLMNISQRERFYKTIDELNRIIVDEELLKDAFDKWAMSREKHVDSIFFSYHNRYLNAAAYRGWIPYPMRQNEIAPLLNFIICEAHRDVVIDILNNRLNDNGKNSKDH